MNLRFWLKAADLQIARAVDRAVRAARGGLRRAGEAWRWLRARLAFLRPVRRPWCALWAGHDWCGLTERDGATVRRAAMCRRCRLTVEHFRGVP